MFSLCSEMEVVLLILFLCAYIATMISVELLLITYIIASSVSEPIFQRYNAPLTHELVMTRWSFKAKTMLQFFQSFVSISVMARRRHIICLVNVFILFYFRPGRVLHAAFNADYP